MGILDNKSSVHNFSLPQDFIVYTLRDSKIIPKKKKEYHRSKIRKNIAFLAKQVIKTPKQGGELWANGGFFSQRLSSRILEKWRAKVLVYRKFFPVEEACHDGRKTEHWMSLPSLYIVEHRLRNCGGKCGVQIAQKIQIYFCLWNKSFIMTRRQGKQDSRSFQYNIEQAVLRYQSLDCHRLGHTRLASGGAEMLAVGFI